MRLNIHKDKLNATGSQALRLPSKKLEALAEIVGSKEKAAKDAEVNLIVTDDIQVRALNKQYRKLDKTTDVLSFPMEVDQRSSVIGEIYISAPRAKAQASEFNHSLATEILRLTCHGLFHILGYDHLTDPTAEHMEELERQALAQLAKPS